MIKINAERLEARRKALAEIGKAEQGGGWIRPAYTPQYTQARDLVASWMEAAGMKVRGDFGLNAFNSYTLEVLKDAGLLSVTASFELRIAQIKDLAKPINTEMIVYGRLPVMVSEQCAIRESAGRCACQTPGQLADRMGSVFPVVKEYGCRNVIYNAHKLYLADKKEDLLSAGLWGMRLLFSTESGRECAEVARGYLGLSAYRPNVLTRGLYYRGVD